MWMPDPRGGPFCSMKEKKHNGKNQEKRRGSRAARVVTRIVMGFFIAALFLSLAGAAVYAWTAAHLDPEDDRAVMESMRGSRTGILYAPSAGAPREDLTVDNYQPVAFDFLYGEENMIWAESGEIPDALRAAFVAIEDHRFYQHDGVDWLRTGKATLNYLFHFSDTFGGSTITQQLVKNVHGERETTPERKLKEIIRATRVERAYSKDEILTYYLNIVPLGNGCVGVKTAARYYFDKTPDALSVTECASLAAITNAPSRYEPIRHPEGNLSRRNQILDAMEKWGYISAEDAAAAKEEPVTLSVTDPVLHGDRNHNWYAETVISDVIRDLSLQLGLSETAATTLLYRGGLSVYTLMDPDVQAAVDSYMQDVSHFPTVDGKQVNAAMVLADPHTGDLLGVSGGIGEKTGSRLFNRATDGLYAPGSSLKPLAIYAPALEEGIVDWGTVWEDLPEAGAEGYWPHNSPDVYIGKITTHEALARSKNTVAVQIYRKLGARRVFDVLQNGLHFSTLADGRGGVTDLAPAPLALGQLSHGVSVRELTAGFACLADGGVWHAPRSYLTVLDAQGKVLLDNTKRNERVFSAETAFLTTAMLQEVVDWGTARSVTLGEDLDTAGKTGTSGSSRDKWFVGYTPYLVGGIHVSCDDGTPLPANCRAHLLAWDSVMHTAHRRYLSDPDEGVSGFTAPPGVVRAIYCRDSGCVPNEHCRAELRGDRTEVGYFRLDRVPQETCPLHIRAAYDPEIGEFVSGDSEGSTLFSFSCLSDPDRRQCPGIEPTDAPYYLESLIRRAEQDRAAEGDRNGDSLGDDDGVRAPDPDAPRPDDPPPGSPDARPPGLDFYPPY